MTADPQVCAHEPNQVKVVFSAAGGTWSAVCLGCLSRWVRTPHAQPDDVPAAVLQAVLASARIVELDKDDLARLGLTEPTDETHPSRNPEPR